MSFIKKYLEEKLLTEKEKIVNISLLGLGTLGSLNQVFKFSERKIKKFEKLGYSRCSSLINKKKILKCKIYFLKKKFNEESTKLYKRIEELDEYYNKHPDKENKENPQIIKYYNEWNRLNKVWKELARRTKNDINRLRDEYEGKK